MKSDGWIERAIKNTQRTLDVIANPGKLFAELSDSQDTSVSWSALIITSLLFSITTLIAYSHNIPFSVEPILAVSNYRILQALLMPVILGLGWLICSMIAMVLNVILRGRTGLPRIMAVSAPAIFVPMWIMLWPTELAVSLGILNPNVTGLPGIWAKHIMPALTFIYTLAMLWLAYWQAFRLLLREAFALAVLSLIPTLGFYSLWLR
ncbi:hypothetical protein KAR34_02315 [bacterium]|nr:hypothetical protein [bacterium]